jgi:hypothetical protein
MSDCYVCGQSCEGTTGAVIDDVFQPMCHEGPDPTCYQRWAWKAPESDRWQFALTLVEEGDE